MISRVHVETPFCSSIARAVAGAAGGIIPSPALACGTTDTPKPIAEGVRPSHTSGDASLRLDQSSVRVRRGGARRTRDESCCLRELRWAGGALAKLGRVRSKELQRRRASRNWRQRNARIAQSKSTARALPSLPSLSPTAGEETPERFSCGSPTRGRIGIIIGSSLIRGGEILILETGTG